MQARPDLRLVSPDDPDAAFVREIEKLRAAGKLELAELIDRARLAWGKR